MRKAISGKRIIAVIMAACVALGTVPAFAAEEDLIGMDAASEEPVLDEVAEDYFEEDQTVFDEEPDDGAFDDVLAAEVISDSFLEDETDLDEPSEDDNVFKDGEAFNGAEEPEAVTEGELLIEDKDVFGDIEDSFETADEIEAEPMAADIVDSGTCGENVTWTLDSEGTLVISGTGKMTNYDVGESPFKYREDVILVIIENGVTSIGNMAFMDCFSLTSIILPDSVTNIGEYAFDSCASLTSITIPDSMTEISENTFSNCVGLTSIIIPDSVTDIRAEAFSHCSSLTSIIIPDSVTRIWRSAFNTCESLTSITIPDSVTEIGENAFSNCVSLKDITIPNSVTSIGIEIFEGCNCLTGINVDFGNPVYDSRNNCNAIIETSSNTLIIGCKNTAIPDSVTNIGDYAFSGCSLTSISIPNSVTRIGNNAFYNCGLTSITIPDSITIIGYYAFDSCKSLTSITIPDSVTYINNRTFLYCDSLADITIPDSVTYIGDYAFGFCKSLTNITIPDSVTSIKDGVFYECYNVTIYGYTGTYAEQYAIENNIPFVALDKVDPQKPTEGDQNTGEKTDDNGETTTPQKEQSETTAPTNNAPASTPQKEQPKPATASSTSTQKPAETVTNVNQLPAPVVTEKITIKKKPTIKKPSATKNKVTVRWAHFKHTSKKAKKIWKGIKKVQIQCATDKAFTNIVKTTTVGKSKKKATIKGLKKNKSYYVRVRYTNKTGYSKWSKVKKIKTKKK